MSFPPATEMFQFAGFASRTYVFSTGYPLRGGLPHSEIPGSPIARISPGLVAACHVLHRLSVPRHPPDALTSRLSATPNGKNHLRRNRRFRRGDRRSVSFAESPGAIPVPPVLVAGAAILSPGGTCKAPPLEDTIGTPHPQPVGHTTLQAGDGWIPPRSQLAYSHLSINNPPSAVLDRPRGISASCRVIGSGAPRRAFGEAFFACRPRPNCVRPVVVEVIGLEPTTSCLQSRRSPS